MTADTCNYYDFIKSVFFYNQNNHSNYTVIFISSCKNEIFCAIALPELQTIMQFIMIVASALLQKCCKRMMPVSCFGITQASPVDDVREEKNHCSPQGLYEGLEDGEFPFLNVLHSSPLSFSYETAATIKFFFVI